MGPVVSRAQQQKVLDYIRLGKEEGATVAAQSPVPDDPALAKGFYVPATFFSGVSREMRIANEEIFGPVVTAIPFDTYEEAISIANQTEYGLVAGVYTSNMDRAFRASREIDAGIVFPNNYYRMFLGTPFGGAKHSGHGREHCIQTLHEYSRVKSIRFPSGIGAIPTMRTVSEVFGD